MQAKSEVTLKFSGELPTATPAANKKVEVSLTDQNGIVFNALINAKSWRKAEANASEFGDWAGAISQYGSVKTRKLISDMKFRSFCSLSSPSVLRFFRTKL